MNFHVCGVTFRPGTIADVIVASLASKFRFGEDAVAESRRIPWFTKNPLGFWVGEFLGQIVIIVQIHALAHFIQVIWNSGKFFEADKTPDDVLSLHDIRQTTQPIQFYVELAFIQGDAPLFRQALAGGLARILRFFRENLAQDLLITLPICFSRENTLLQLIGFTPTGLKSPQKGYPLLAVRTQEFVGRIETLMLSSDRSVEGAQHVLGNRSHEGAGKDNSFSNWHVRERDSIYWSESG